MLNARSQWHNVYKYVGVHQYTSCSTDSEKLLLHNKNLLTQLAVFSKKRVYIVLLMAVGRPCVFHWSSWKPFITKISYFTCSLVITSRWTLSILWSLGQWSRSQWPWMSKCFTLIFLKTIIPNNVSKGPEKGRICIVRHFLLLFDTWNMFNRYI